MGDVSISQNDPRIKIATRNIILMMIGKMTSLLDLGIYTFAMGLYVLKTTGSRRRFCNYAYLRFYSKNGMWTNCWGYGRPNKQTVGCYCCRFIK